MAHDPDGCLFLPHPPPPHMHAATAGGRRRSDAAKCYTAGSGAGFHKLHAIRTLLNDMSPWRWLRPFEGRPVGHIVAMGLFYHAVGLVLMAAGNAVAHSVVPGYAPSAIPVSVAAALASGPIEESVFFGIPYLVFSSPYALLAAGSAWSLLHLFNSPVLDPAGVSYGAFLFTIPHVFFSVRTWAGGRGWVAVAFHSAWNAGVLAYACGTGAMMCTAFGQGEFFVRDVLLVPVSASVSVLIYLSYRWKQGRRFPAVFRAAALAVLIGCAAPMLALDMASLLLP